MSLENCQIISKEMVALPKFSIKRLRKNLSDWSITKITKKTTQNRNALKQHVSEVIKDLGIKKLQKAKNSGPNR